MFVLRDACHADSEDAALWTLYAASCVRAGKIATARQAFTQALWLRERCRDEARARVTRGLLSALKSDRAA